MKNLIKTIFFIFAVLPAFKAFTQQKQVASPKMVAMYHALPDRILIRWAPSGYASWNEANRLGYTVERTTVKEWDAAPGKNWGNQVTVKAATSPQWEKIATANDLAAVAWQAIYGESFSVEINGGPMSSIVNKASEQEQRFTFGLTACNRDFKVACMAGLGFADSTVTKNEKYIYRIIRNRQNILQPADTAFVMASTADYKPLPKIYKPVAQFKDRQASIIWESKLYESTYSAFIVERAEESGAFHILPGPPSGDFNPEVNGGMLITDSIPNGKLFRYRVRGISYFGEIGPPSEEMKGMAKETNSVKPHISTYHLLQEGNVELKWEFPQENNRLIDHFLLEQAGRVDGPYISFLKIQDVTKRSETINPNQFTNYFTIGAVGKDGSVLKSMPMLIQMIDSIPPAPPTGLAGEMDSLGVVTLKWKANAENDVAGYKILRGNLKNEEFSTLNTSPLLQTSFIDTVGLHLLNSEVYYRIIAVDHVNNHSKPSEICTVVKPDTVPPTAPVFANYEITDNCLKINWHNSSSSDLENTRLLRQAGTNGSVETIRSWKDNSLISVTDTLKRGSTTYVYDLVSTDKKGNQTHALRKLEVTAPVLALKNIITDFNGGANANEHAVTLSWQINTTSPAQINLYRGKGQKPPTFYKTLTGNATKFYDTQVQLAENYAYYLKAVFDNGDFSTTPIITVKF